MSEPLTAAEIKYFEDRHNEELLCRSCKEWTVRGEPCCPGSGIECESVCPICEENQ